MQTVPILSVPNQDLNIILSNQSVKLRIYTLSTNFFQSQVQALFIDVFVNNTLIIGGVLCENLTAIIRSKYLGFVGDLVFVDERGFTDPVYTGLGTRYLLFYLLPEELPIWIQ